MTFLPAKFWLHSITAEGSCARQLENQMQGTSHVR